MSAIVQQQEFEFQGLFQKAQGRLAELEQQHAEATKSVAPGLTVNPHPDLEKVQRIFGYLDSLRRIHDAMSNAAMRLAKIESEILLLEDQDGVVSKELLECQAKVNAAAQSFDVDTVAKMQVRIAAIEKIRAVARNRFTALDSNKNNVQSEFNREQNSYIHYKRDFERLDIRILG